VFCDSAKVFILFESDLVIRKLFIKTHGDDNTVLFKLGTTELVFKRGAATEYFWVILPPASCTALVVRLIAQANELTAPCPFSRAEILDRPLEDCRACILGKRRVSRSPVGVARRDSHGPGENWSSDIMFAKTEKGQRGAVGVAVENNFNFIVVRRLPSKNASDLLLFVKLELVALDSTPHELLTGIKTSERHVNLPFGAIVAVSTPEKGKPKRVAILVGRNWG
jgi:hypothetical protein